MMHRCSGSLMLIDYQGHKRWIHFTLAAALISMGSWYWLDRTTPEGLTGGSIPGLAYGIVGSMLMVLYP